MNNLPASSKRPAAGAAPSAKPVYWRVEGSLLELGAMRPVGFFTWNSQSFAERWARRAGMAGMAVARPFAYAASRSFATRFLHTLLRGVSRDRLDLLGEEYFHYVLRPQLRSKAVDALREALQNGEQIVLVGQLLEDIMRPLANHVGVDKFVANRLEFRDGEATGRLLDPIVRPRGPLAWIAAGATAGRVPRERLIEQLGWEKNPGVLEAAIVPVERPTPARRESVAVFSETPEVRQLQVRESLARRHILLIGVTGFIGKVWLVNLLEDVPQIGKITLLVRKNRTTAAEKRVEKILEESPAFDSLQERYGRGLAAFLRERVEVVEGDVSQPGLGLDDATRERLQKSLDVIVNSAGL